MTLTGEGAGTAPAAAGSDTANLARSTRRNRVTLTEAGAQLGLSPATLRSQIRNGALRGTMIGKTWTVTPREVEKYRREHLGRVGRPKV